LRTVGSGRFFADPKGADAHSCKCACCKNSCLPCIAECSAHSPVLPGGEEPGDVPPDLLIDEGEGGQDEHGQVRLEQHLPDDDLGKQPQRQAGVSLLALAAVLVAVGAMAALAVRAMRPSAGHLL
jgi:hypothetical protein